MELEVEEVHKNAVYPWDKWLGKKRPFEIRQGVDFSCQLHSMAQQIRNVAKKRGLRVSLHLKGMSITIKNLGEA